MRTTYSVISAAIVFSISASAFAAGTTTPQTDPCRAKAIDAAQESYGNDPYRTTIKTVVAGQSYKVNVGIGNPEDGAHLYNVTFANGCDGKAVAIEAEEVAINPLQDAAHAVYDKLVSYNTDIPSSYEVSTSDLPAKVLKEYSLSEKNLASDGTTNLKVSVFKVEVDGQDTFAIFTPVLHDSIREDFYVLDSKGNEIDSASVYHEGDVGGNGVSWQNETVQK